MLNRDRNRKLGMASRETIRSLTQRQFIISNIQRP